MISRLTFDTWVRHVIGKIGKISHLKMFFVKYLTYICGHLVSGYGLVPSNNKLKPHLEITNHICISSNHKHYLNHSYIKLNKGVYFHIILS